MKYIYGPVPSRRLGMSLGIDPIPSKTCNYQCIYCQLGKTTNFTNSRENFYPKKDIIDEMNKTIKLYEDRIDYITFVGSGEPTLYLDLIDLIKTAKMLSKKPVCVITNGGLFYDKNVRKALMKADAVLPSLDAGDEKTYIKVNRPHPSIQFKSIIQGFLTFKEGFEGKFWVEVMLVKEVNDSREQLLKIKDQIDLIKPDRIDFNVPIRPPAENWVKIPDKKLIALLNEIFGEYNNINFPEMGKFNIFSLNFEKELLAIIERHPMRQEQIIETFSSKELNKKAILQKLEEFRLQRIIKKISYSDKTFWKLP